MTYYSQIKHSRWFFNVSTRMTALHLRIAEFKFLELTYNKKKCYIQKEGKFLTLQKNCEQNVTIGTVKLTLKIPP